jgi:hypothetical protein
VLSGSKSKVREYPFYFVLKEFLEEGSFIKDNFSSLQTILTLKETPQ